jgi:hypothetical protein
MTRTLPAAAVAALLLSVAGAAQAETVIRYKDIEAATAATTAQRAARAAEGVKPAEPPKVERKPVNQSFGWEGGAPVTTGRTAESEAERDRQRDLAEQRFLTQKSIRKPQTGGEEAGPEASKTLAGPHAPTAPSVPTVTLAAPGKGGAAQIATNEKADASPTASRIARELAEQLRGRKPEGARGHFVLEDIAPTGEVRAGTAIDTAAR